MIFNFNYNTPGLNGKDGLMRSHYRKKKIWITRMINDIIPQVDGVFKGRVKITYRRGYLSVPMDKDNVTASAKYWLDALVRCGVIVDDHEDVVELVTEQFKTKKGSWLTSIQIENND